jgi:hypothetical protein
MPLKSDPDGRRRFASEGLVYFPMFDGDSMVPCAVTSAALLALATDEGLEPQRVEAIFERFRLEIERVASEKYDRGERVGEEVIVGTADV